MFASLALTPATCGELTHEAPLRLQCPTAVIRVVRFDCGLDHLVDPADPVIATPIPQPKMESVRLDVEETFPEGCLADRTQAQVLRPCTRLR